MMWFRNQRTDGLFT